MKRLALALSALLIFAVPSFAEKDCNEATDTASALQCISDKLAKADGELNRAYEALVGDLRDWDDNAGASAKNGAVSRLRAAQRAWIAFRDAECALRDHVMEGGSFQPILNSTCRDDLTRARLGQLADIAMAFEPDDGVSDDEACYTLGEVVRRLASLHQYGGDANEMLTQMRTDGISELNLIRYEKIADEIASSPRLTSEKDREFAIDYQVKTYTAECS